MITGMKFTGDKACDDVFITGTIFDRAGQRMSKTKGNGVDPLDVFDKYGVDATRLVLASIGSTDTRWNDNQVESYRNFANKIWNAARFCLLNSEGAQVGLGFEGEPERWALLHPFMPFITEELWQRLPGVGKGSLHSAYRAAEVTPTVMLAEFPQADEALIDERAEAEMRSVIELVSRVRNIRTELSVKPSEEV